MATEAEIVDAKIKLKEANDVVSSIIDRYVRNSMAGIAGEKNEYVLSDMLLRGKIDVSEIGDEFDSVRNDKSVSAEEMDSSHSAESDIVDEMDVAQRNENTVGDERDEVQENSGQTESGVRFNEFGEIVRDENTAVNRRDVSGSEAGQDIPTFTPPVMDGEIPTFTPPENQADKKNGIVDENVNKLGADNGNGEKVEDSKAAEANNKEFKPIDFSFEDENEVAAEAENQKRAELSAEAASGRVDNLSDDALERLKASLKVAGEEERER